MAYAHGFLIEIGMLAVATGTISVAITNSHLTRSLRLRYLDAPYMLGELISCSFCMGFWISGALCWLEYGSLHAWPWLVVWGLGAMWSGVLLRLYLFREAENDELREVLRECRQSLNDLLDG